MPWDGYRHLTDADLKAVWAYLKTVKPIRNLVPDWEPPAVSPAPAK
jgi:ligand-binding SRPBCC domain-containing protein